MAEILPKEIEREMVRPLMRRGAQLVEVLPKEEYERVHPAGAVNLPMVMLSRRTADKLQWDKPVIVYAADSLDDRSARAAWRLASLGFTQVFRYAGGKADWLANGLPVEGREARAPGAGDLADLDVPTCTRGERVGEVRKSVQAEGWDTCVVVNDQMVVLGVLNADDLTKADQSWPADEAMERDPQTYRLDAPPEAVAAFFHANRGAQSALVTTTDGKLYGLIKRDAAL